MGYSCLWLCLSWMPQTGKIVVWDECRKEALVLPSLLFHRNEGKGLTFWMPSELENVSDHLQHHIIERKYTRLKGAYLVMMGLSEIYSEIKYKSKWTLNPCEKGFDMEKKPLWMWCSPLHCNSLMEDNASINLFLFLFYKHIDFPFKT